MSENQGDRLALCFLTKGTDWHFGSELGAKLEPPLTENYLHTVPLAKNSKGKNAARFARFAFLALSVSCSFEMVCTVTTAINDATNTNDINDTTDTTAAKCFALADSNSTIEKWLLRMDRQLAINVK